ncbi:HEAT repeat family protein [Klebsormidium nitens]|uniref:HEAT repeat family protein n=1 Tax=Klebsormidium nitens TaxID=105231 RepID=A0A1Y1I3V9_KLENI|nr:HEAT repeat family protein [Klebsormidium nitens]|eukprot:GAQ84109.1 HEAT repeat family protein [Klebsormidium nitens]
MASAEEEIARHLTACRQSGGEGALEHLQAAQSILLQHPSELLPRFLPDVLELQDAPLGAARRWLAESLEAAGLAVPSLLVSILPTLQRLLSDSQPGVVKRTLQTGRLLMPEVMRQMLQDFKPESDSASEMARLWEAARQFKDAAVATALQHINSGVRLYGVKFTEAVILLYTPQTTTSATIENGSAYTAVHAGLVPPGHPLLDSSLLAVDATRHLASLLGQLRGPSAYSIPTPVMLVLISSLTAIARQRMSFFGRVLPVLLSLSQPPADPGASNSGGDVKPRVHPPSILHALKTAYLTLVRLPDSSVAPWRERLLSGLRSIGANDAASTEERRLEKQSSQQREAATRKRGQAQAPEQTQGGAPTGDGREGGPKRVKKEEGDIEPDVKPAAGGPSRLPGGPTLDTMLGLVCQLAARTEPEAQAQLRQLVDQMPIGLLVDLVMASMKNDPLPKPAVKMEPGGGVQEAKPPKQKMPPGFPPPAKPALPPQVKREHPAPTPPPSTQARVNPPQPLARTPTPPLATGPLVAGVGEGRWAVVPLSSAQRVEQARGAITRVVKAGQLVRGARAGQLRAALIGRMLAQAEEEVETGRVEAIVAQLFGDALRNDALEVALQWLYCMYALYQLQQEEGADVMDEDGADVMDEDGVGAKALAVLDDGREAPEAYQALLLLLARAAASRLPSSDRSFQRLLCDAPALPPSILALLQSMLLPPPPEAEDGTPPESGLREGGAAGYLERVTQSLSALWALILQRPMLRHECLEIALKCTYEHPNEEVRNKAIRLVANKLYPLPYCRDAIQATAREQLEEATQEEAALEGVSQAAEKDDEEGRARLERTESGREAGTSADAAKQKMSLFFGLCYKSPELLPQLVARYGKAGKGAKQAILRQIPLLLKSVGPASPPVLAILEDPPAGVEPLLLQILNVLTEGAAPPEELTQRVKTLYQTKLKDARLLIPILSFMTKDEARSVFPALVTLPLPQFKLALNRLLQGSAATGPALTPPEVLVALHEVDPKRDGVPLKKVTDACTACMAQRTIFTPQVLATTLNQLVERSPIPLLFMRTVLQSVGASPSLRPFVVELLGRLVRREIWNMPQLWVGFLKAAHHTVPDSLPVLLQLPARQVAEVVAKNPDLKPLLAAHVTHTSARTALPRSILAVLGLASEGGPA